MKRLVCILTLIIANSAVLAHESIKTVNSRITTESGRIYRELCTVNGNISIEQGATAHSAESVNGDITIADQAKVGMIKTVNGDALLGAAVEVNNDIETVNGDITIGKNSRIYGKASTTNGAITIDQAEIMNGLETVNGDITVGPGSIVHNGITVSKPNRGWFNFGSTTTKASGTPPRIVIGENVAVEGELYFEREVELFVHDSARIEKVFGATVKRFSGNTP